MSQTLTTLGVILGLTMVIGLSPLGHANGGRANSDWSSQCSTDLSSAKTYDPRKVAQAVEIIKWLNILQSDQLELLRWASSRHRSDSLLLLHAANGHLIPPRPRRFYRAMVPDEFRRSYESAISKNFAKKVQAEWSHVSPEDSDKNSARAYRMIQSLFSFQGAVNAGGIRTYTGLTIFYTAEAGHTAEYQFIGLDRPQFDILKSILDPLRDPEVFILVFTYARVRLPNLYERTHFIENELAHQNYSAREIESLARPSTIEVLLKDIAEFARSHSSSKDVAVQPNSERIPRTALELPLPRPAPVTNLPVAPTFSTEHLREGHPRHMTLAGTDLKAVEKNLIQVQIYLNDLLLHALARPVTKTPWDHVSNSYRGDPAGLRALHDQLRNGLDALTESSSVILTVLDQMSDLERRVGIEVAAVRALPKPAVQVEALSPSQRFALENIVDLSESLPSAVTQARQALALRGQHTTEQKRAINNLEYLVSIRLTLLFTPDGGDQADPIPEALRGLARPEESN